ncbi:dihydroneopterin aldolase [Olleya sp. AH-315-K02]|nr:dihydroneopterin aldolase [Olleya sp. AH-315-K02]
MGIIKIKNIKVYAYHGCLKEETKIGSEYRVDLVVKADLSSSSKTDNLNDTVDYVLLNKIVKEEMNIPSKLLETVAKRVLDRVFIENGLVRKAIISVSKINPPIGGDVGMVTIKLSGKRKP